MANCVNCSAPLPANALTCQYCGSRNDVDLAGIHYHTTHEPTGARTCPRCAIPLQTIDLKLQGRFLIERCATCLGLFFDPGELEALLDTTVTNVYAINHAQLAGISQARRAEDFGVSYVKCPVCTTIMNRVNFGVRSGVIVDRCKEHGVWLDGGELRQLGEWVKAGGKLLDQQRQEERKKENTAREAEERATLARAGTMEEEGGLLSRRTGWHTNDPDLLDMLWHAARFILR